MTIECISFDLDDTLRDCDSVIARAEAKLIEWLHQKMPAVMERHDEQSLVAHRREFALANPDISFDLTLLRKRWLADIASEFHYPPEQSEEGFLIFLKARNDVVLYPGVPETLCHLGRRFRLGAITNGNADVHYIGIGRLFAYVVTAADAKAAKPAPAIFHLAAAKSGSTLENTLHVGDDPARDVLGANALGMRTAWINPASTPWPGGQVPDLVLTDVTQLPERIEELLA